MAIRNVAAIDLGAESGRVMLARFDGQRLDLEEIHRFPNRPVRVMGHLFWDILDLWREIQAGLRKASAQAGELDSVGVDSWGVDYALLDTHGLPVNQPFHYRDQRTNGVMARVFDLLSKETIYQRTGIQFLPFNTLYQLFAHQRMQPAALSAASRLLLIPDVFHCWLTGEQVSEYTNATTTQMWDSAAHGWITDLLETLELPTHYLPPVVEAGTRLGQVRPELASIIGPAQVCVPATHDTGSAIAALPSTQTCSWGYISSGTWSLVGLELPQPLVTDAAQEKNFTNEGGIFSTTRFLKNVMGLWLLQACQRQWEQEGRVQDYASLVASIGLTPTFAAVIQPDDERFLAPDNMPAAINDALVKRGKQPLHTPVDFARCIMESLVLRYRQVLEETAHLTGTRLDGVHVIGGGARNQTLNQWLADAIQLPVIAGPYEATAVGNALMQLVGLGELHSLLEVRMLAQTLPTRTYAPRPGSRQQWDEVYHCGLDA